MVKGKSWGDTKQQNFNESWDKKIDFFQFPSGEELRIRLVGNVYLLGRHWPTILTKFVPGQKPKVFPAWCTKFDSATEELNPERVCPLCDDFDMYLEKLAVTNVIVRKFQDGRSRRENPVVPVIWRHSDVDKVFKKAYEKFKADPADPKKGCDFSVEYDPNNKKSRWTIQREDQTPLTDEEKSYELVDFESVIPEFEDPQVMAEHARDMKKSIVRSGYYVLPLKNGEDGWAAYKPDSNGKPYTAFADLVAFKEGKQLPPGGHGKVSHSDDDEAPVARRRRVEEDEEDAPVAKPAPKAAPKPVAAAKAPVEEDEPSADDEEEAAPPPPRVKAKAPAPLPEEDEAEEDAPPPKPAVKAAPAKDSGGGTPAKHEAWSSKFGIAWENKNGKNVPSCWGEYAGSKKCTQCPESHACLEASDG